MSSSQKLEAFWLKVAMLNVQITPLNINASVSLRQTTASYCNCSSRDCEMSRPTRHQVVWRCTFTQDQVGVDIQPDTWALLSHEKLSIIAGMGQIPNTESWLGITFLSPFCPPTFPLNTSLLLLLLLSFMFVNLDQQNLAAKNKPSILHRLMQTQTPAVGGKDLNCEPARTTESVETHVPVFQLLNNSVKASSW